MSVYIIYYVLHNKSEDEINNTLNVSIIYIYNIIRDIFTGYRQSRKFGHRAQSPNISGKVYFKPYTLIIVFK